MSESLSTHPSRKPDEKVVLGADTRADAVAFRAWVIGETRREGVDGPSVTVSPLPEHVEFTDVETPIHRVEFESLPSGRYWINTQENDKHKRAILTPAADELRERLRVALDDGQASLGEVDT